jgi:dihydroorotate dehydrogenase (NAD+) catalytic subunit
LVTPAITRRPRHRGRPSPLRETPAGLLLAGPYPSVGYRTALRRHVPAWEASPVPVIANLPAEDADECLEVASALADHGGVAAVELVLPAQMLREGGAAALGRLCERVLAVWPASLIAKLPYGTDDLLNSIEAAAAGGADAVALGGGFPGRVFEYGTRDTPPRAMSGRVVGPATRPLALHVVATVCAATRVPVIASGGITRAEDALDFLLAGAQAVQVGSASLRDPSVVVDMAAGLAELLQATGAPSVVALRNRRRGEGSPLYPGE